MKRNFTPAGRLRKDFNAVRTYPVPDGITPDPAAYRGDLLMNFIKSRKGTELVEIIELENMLRLLKGDEQRKIWMKIATNEDLTNGELKMLSLIKDLIVDLHKLKYGEKRVNINTDFKDIREMMFGARAGDNGTEFSGGKPAGTETSSGEVKQSAPVGESPII